MTKVINIKNRISSNKLNKYFLVYTFGHIISVLVSLLLLPLFTKHLPKLEFGLIGILWLAGPLMSRIINLGMDVSISLKFYKLDKKELSSYLYNGISGITFCGLVVLTIGLWRTNLIHSIFHQTMSATIFSLFIFSILFSIYSTMMKSFLQLAGKAALNVVMTILPSLFITATTYYLVMYVNKSYTSYIIGMAVGNGIFGIIALIYFFKNYSIKHFYPSCSIIKRLLRVGLPVIPDTVGVIILAAGDRYVIKSLIGLEAVAVYVYGYRFAESILLSFFRPFQKALGPVVLEKASLNFQKAGVYNKNIIDSILIFFPILISIIIIPFKDLMIWLGGNGYEQSYLIFIITLMGILLYNTAQINSNLLNYLERTELSMIVVLLGAGMNVGLNIWLIPKYGIVAAAFTTIFSYLFMLSMVVILLNHFITNRLSLVNILSRLLPFCVYLFTIYYVDNITDNLISWQIYTLKIILVFLFILTSVFIFPELRYSIRRLILIFRSLQTNR